MYDIVRLIPTGRVTSYGAIAKALGTASSSRMVGWAMNACHGQKDIPAHRVVNRNGVLTGKFHFSEIDEMQKSLEKEGLIIKDDKILNFSDVYWDPLTEIGL